DKNLSNCSAARRSSESLGKSRATEVAITLSDLPYVIGIFANSKSFRLNIGKWSLMGFTLKSKKSRIEELFITRTLSIQNNFSLSSFKFMTIFVPLFLLVKFNSPVRLLYEGATKENAGSNTLAKFRSSIGSSGVTGIGAKLNEKTRPPSLVLAEKT